MTAVYGLSMDPTGEVGVAVVRARRWLDIHNGTGGPELGLRVAKVAEEAGEAIGAWIGLVGQNPRKGVTHTADEVAAELADVVLTALVAMCSLGYDPAVVMRGCARKVLDRIPASADPYPVRPMQPEPGA